MKNETYSGSEHNRAKEIITTPEGFKIHGKNETSLIRSLTALNRTPISQLEQKMRPRNSSSAGFLGSHESLTEVLANDNDTVLGMGQNHQDLADFLSRFDDEQGELEQYKIIDINGKKFAHEVERWRGYQYSPFGDGTVTDSDHTVISLETGARIDYSGLLPEMIRRYGFYEGKGTDYRLDPESIAEVAGFTPPPPDDRVVQLVQNRDAQVDITTSEQLSRVSSLNSAKVDVLSGQNYRIVPKDSDALLKLVRSLHDSESDESQEKKERQEHVASRVDAQSISPQPYQIESYDATLTETIPKDFPQLEQAVLQGIDRLQLPRESDGSTNSYAVQDFLEGTLRGISGESDGQDNPHKGYYEGLLTKLGRGPQTTFQLYEAATRLEPELVAELDTSLPSLKTDIIAFSKQLGLYVSEGMDLKELLGLKGNIEKYHKTIGHSRKLAHGLGRIPDAQEGDIITLVSIVNITKSDPDHKFTPEEEEAMRKLKVDPKLIPYAHKAALIYGSTPDSVITQIYNSSAKSEHDRDK